MTPTSFFRTCLVTICLGVVTMGIALPSQALPIRFVIEPGSTVSIDSGDPIPLSGSFELEFIGLKDEAFGGGINDEAFSISNLVVQTATLQFVQVSSPLNSATNVFDAANLFLAGGFQVVTRTVGTIEGNPVDVTFQWGALDDESFIGNTLFDDGASLGTPGNDRVVNLAAGFDGIRVYDFRIQAQAVGEVPDGGVVEVIIDIKPRGFPNRINPKSRGVIPVAILTTDKFDAATANPNSIEFGPGGATPVHSALEDVDRDSDLDMVLDFNTQGSGIQCGDTSASLTGETFSGQAIQGSDSIMTVGCR